MNPALAALTRIINRAVAEGAPVLQNRTRENMTGADCTLNGRPALVCGAKERFAQIVARDGSARAEFSWHAVANVLDQGGAFKS